MRPKPFVPEDLDGDPRYIREHTQGLAWHQCVYRTLYADTDRSGVVYHANYLRYFEVGRTSLMRDAAYPYREIEESGFVYPIIQVGIDYFSPLRYDDPMVIYHPAGNPGAGEASVRLRHHPRADRGHRLQGVHATLRHQSGRHPGGRGRKNAFRYGTISPVIRTERLPLDIEVFPCLVDHRFEGKAVFPAVEAMQVLAAAVQKAVPPGRRPFDP